MYHCQSQTQQAVAEQAFLAIAPEIWWKALKISTEMHSYTNYELLVNVKIDQEMQIIVKQP